MVRNMDEELEKQYAALKEKYIELRDRQIELAEAHMRNLELYYGVKREMVILDKELADLKTKIGSKVEEEG